MLEDTRRGTLDLRNLSASQVAHVVDPEGGRNCLVAERKPFLVAFASLCVCIAVNSLWAILTYKLHNIPVEIHLNQFSSFCVK